MARFVGPLHPCEYCGKETTNKRFCSWRCNGQAHVDKWRGQHHTEETKALFRQQRKGRKNPHIKELQRLAKLGKLRLMPPRIIACAFCGNPKRVHTKSTQRFCSRQCAYNYWRGKPRPKRQLAKHGSGKSGYRK